MMGKTDMVENRSPVFGPEWLTNPIILFIYLAPSLRRLTLIPLQKALY